MLSASVGPKNYLRVCLSIDKKPKTYTIHRLVAITFLGQKPENQMVCHQDGNKNNNSLDNLRYGTAQDNADDSVRLDALLKGNAHPKSILTEEQVGKIRELSKSGLSRRKIAEMFKVHPATIQQLLEGRSWKHV